MSSSSGIIAEKHRLPLSRLSLASELAANQQSTSRFAKPGTSTTTDWGLLKQPDNQKSSCRPRGRHSHTRCRHSRHFLYAARIQQVAAFLGLGGVDVLLQFPQAVGLR